MMLDTMVLWLAFSLAMASPGPANTVGAERPDPGCLPEVERIRDAAHAADVPPGWASTDVPDLVWRLVEAASSTNGDQQRCMLRAAEDEARLSDDPVKGPFAVAVVLGIRAETEGGQAKVRTVSALYSQLGVVLEVEPDHARARHLLGRIHAAVCRMSSVTRWLATRLLGGNVLRQATWEEAERNLAFAERSAPEVVDHHLQLANLYRDTGRLELAHEELRHALALPATTPRETAARAEAERTVREIERRLAAR
jgi:hypothetical protein